MSPRFTNSEPAYRAPISQWQRDRATGRIHSMPGVNSVRFWAETAAFGAILVVPCLLWWAL